MFTIINVNIIAHTIENRTRTALQTILSLKMMTRVTEIHAQAAISKN